MRNITKETMEIVANKEVIAVNQGDDVYVDAIVFGSWMVVHLLLCINNF